MAKDWHEENYWDAARAAEFLKISSNNLRVITSRFKRIHLELGHKDNGKCTCLLVSHSGRKEVNGRSFSTSYYRREKVEGYALFRKGGNTLEREANTRQRKAAKVQPVGKTSIGRPSQRTGR